MKSVLFASLMVASVSADSSATDAPPNHTVYNCQKVRQDVADANAMIYNGVCDAEVNCGPFSYDLGDCWASTSDNCQDDDSWYDLGRKDFRCSTKTGGIRLGRAGNNDGGQAKHSAWTSACDCYEDCKVIAAAAGQNLTAFDHYSGKCRCWSGICDTSDDGSMPCHDGGDDPSDGGSPNDGGDGDPDGGNNWRCPAQIYFPQLKYDCDGQEITFRYPDISTYVGDGFCDDGSTLNQVFASTVTDFAFNFNCEAYDYDGGDCKLDCHESIYWATDFVNLGTPNQQINDCFSDVFAETTWSTVCECYTFCADFTTSTEQQFLFDHDDRDMCRCFMEVNNHAATLADLDDDYTAAQSTFTSTVTETKFCGLNSDCMIYEPKRKSSCYHDGDQDYTLGVYDVNDVYDSENIGDTVQTFDEYASSSCNDAAMCLKNSYSHGKCFDCTRFSADKQSKSYCDPSTGDLGVAITFDDLDELISDGYLEGTNAVDTTTDGDNCACLNYCWSIYMEGIIVDGEPGTILFEYFNVIAAFELAYSQVDDQCLCWFDCPDTLPCGTTPGDCVDEDTTTVWHSTVVDLNFLE